MPQTELIDINIVDVLENAIDLFKQGSKINISFKNELNDDNIEVKSDKNQMLRVFNNILKNAEQAMENIDNPQIDIQIKALDKNILIVIKDNGCGIPDEMKEKIFIPKFTTKSSGTGLGLPMVKNIIELSGGKIWVESVINKETSFYITLKK